jgi:hypothetical protein
MSLYLKEKERREAPQNIRWPPYDPVLAKKLRKLRKLKRKIWYGNKH